jgi:four helix bundle protein
VSASHFRELEVWQVAMQLAKQTYLLTGEFPRDERFGLSSQPIPSNIAEGNARSSGRDYARFVSIAIGSAAELQTQLLLSRELGIGNEATRMRVLELCDRVGRMLLRLHQSLERRLLTESRVPSPESR